MELNKSSLVPFQVNDPISGEDITNNIRLTAIEQGGVPSPYLKPNGDATFTVIAAAEEDVTEATTFKLEVDYGGLPYELEASTDITVSGTTAGQFKVKFIEPASLAQVVEQNVEFYYDYQATYKGVYLGDGGCQANIPVPGITPVDGVTLLREEVLADGITHRVWFKATLRTGNLVGLTVNIRRLPLVTPGVPDTDYLYATLRLKVIAAGSTELSIVMYDWYSVNIQGIMGAEMISFFEIYQGKTKLSLLDPTLSYAITDNGNMASPYNRLSFVTIPEGIRWTIKGLPSSSSTPPLGGITLTVKKGSDQATQNLSVSVYSGSNNMYHTKFLIGPETNKKKNSVIEIGNYISNIPPWFAPANGVFESGTLTLKDIKNNVIIQTVDVKGMSVNSINRFIVEQAASWMGQQAYFGPAVLKCPYTDKRMPEFYYVPVTMSHSAFTVPEAPYVFTTNTKTINGNTGANSAVLISCKQDRGNGPELIPGDFSMVYVEGAAAGTSGTNLKNGQMSQQLAARGSEGDVRIYGKFTPTGGTEMDFSVIVQASFANKITTTEKTVQVKVFDVLNTPPFDVYNDGVLINDQIRNVRLIKDRQYFSPLPDDPNSWEVVDGRTTETLFPQYFTYEARVNGIWETLTARGNYNVAAWNGVTLAVTAEYITGDKTGKTLYIAKGIEKKYTFYPVYKGMPAANKIRLGLPPSLTNLEILSQEVVGDSVVVTLLARDTPPSGNTPFYYRVKDVPVEELVEGKTQITHTVYIGVVTPGLYVGFGTIEPSTAGLNVIRKWKPFVLMDSEKVSMNDPRLEFTLSGTTTIALFNKIAGVDNDYLYLYSNKLPGSPGIYYQNMKMVYTRENGVKETWGPTQFSLGFDNNKSVELLITLLDQPQANTDNVLGLKFSNPDGSVLPFPTLVGTPKIVISPDNSNAVIDGVGYFEPGKLKFKSGWTGGSIDFTGTFAFPNLRPGPVIINVPPAKITVTPNKTSFEGFKGTSTEVKFTLSQDRLINDVVVPYNFSDATIASTATTTGPVQTVDTIKNVNGEFSANFIGGGAEGDVTAEFTVTDADGFSYKVILVIEATVDSSGMAFTLSKSSITGVAGYQETIPGTLLWNGSKLNMADGNINYTVEPAGYGQVVGKGTNDITVRIIKNSVTDETVECKVIANWSGRTTPADLTINVNKSINITPNVMNVKVWDTVSGAPFSITDLSGTKITPSEVHAENTPWFKPAGFKNWFIIQADKPEPEQDFIVKWYYTLPGETIENSIDIVYHLAGYDGDPVTFKVEGQTVYTTGQQSYFRITPLYKGVTVAIKPLYLGMTPGETYFDYNNKTESVGSVTVWISAKNNPVALVTQNFMIRVPGIDPDSTNHDYVVPVVVTIYKAGEPLLLTKPNPSEITGRLGDVFKIHCPLTDNGQVVKLPTYTWETPVPNDVIELVPGSITDDTFDVRFIKDIDVNSKVSTVRLGFSFTTVMGTKYLASTNLGVTQLTLHPKLTPAPGFQSIGQGDVDNPVTLTQSVLNPE